MHNHFCAANIIIIIIGGTGRRTVRDGIVIEYHTKKIKLQSSHNTDRHCRLAMLKIGRLLQSIHRSPFFSITNSGVLGFKKVRKQMQFQPYI